MFHQSSPMEDVEDASSQSLGPILAVHMQAVVFSQSYVFAVKPICSVTGESFCPDRSITIQAGVVSNKDMLGKL